MSELTWYLSRATGVVSICLLTTTVVLGLLTAGRGVRPGHRTGVVMGLHRWLSLGMLAFLAAHVVTAVVDTYVDISWTAAVVPFTSAYEPLLVGLGTIALDIMVAVVVTSLLRHRIPERAWRWTHLSAYLMWPVAMAHGVLMSTASAPVLRGVTITCGVIVAATVAWRLLQVTPDEERRATIAAEEWA